MSTPTEHRAKADENAAFARKQELATQTGVEWAATAYFYSSLHYVNALLLKKNLPRHSFDTHSKRKQLFAMDSDLKPISREYNDLEYFSRNARYFCKAITAEQVKDEVIPAFEAVKTHIGKKL